jgi:AmmeMemoRadiSam system protein A
MLSPNPSYPAANPDQSSGTMPETQLFSELERHTLLLLARDSIHQGLTQGTPLQIDVDKQPEALRVKHACFVTLHLRHALRGCIGHLEAVQPVVKDVVDNAYAAAFRDPRFAPINCIEFEALCIEISVLTPAQPIQFDSEEQLLASLQPGIDGIILAENDAERVRRGTFLPSVWEQLPNPRDFLHHLKLKAGLAPDHWSKELRAWRYRTECFGE